jgi:hypothetical protein
MKKLILNLIAALMIVGASASGPAFARPPKPGPDFVWVPPHTTPGGVLIQGYWRYDGPAQSGRTWVPGHYNRRGVWVPGHWKNLGAAPHPGAVWVPGHRAPDGRWIPGHWR